MNTTTKRPECELDGCHRQQSRTGWRVIVRDEDGLVIRSAKVCGHHAAIDRGNRALAERA